MANVITLTGKRILGSGWGIFVYRDDACVGFGYAKAFDRAVSLAIESADIEDSEVDIDDALLAHLQRDDVTPKPTSLLRLVRGSE